MVRVEPSSTRPIVFRPLVVGLRSETGPAEWSTNPTCTASKKYQSMTESWLSVDELAQRPGHVGPAGGAGRCCSDGVKRHVN